MGAGQMNGQIVIFSQPRGATMHGGRSGTDFLSDCHNYFISRKKKLCQVNQLKVVDCQGLETVCSFITPEVITFPAQLSMSNLCL